MTEDDPNRRLRQKEIADLLRSQDLAGTEAGRELHALSPNTQIDSLEIPEEEILFESNVFSGPVLWHVTLRFPEGDGEPVVASETLPGVFRGHLEDGEPMLDSLDVDVSALVDVAAEQQQPAGEE